METAVTELREVLQAVLKDPNMPLSITSLDGKEASTVALARGILGELEALNASAVTAQRDVSAALARIQLQIAETNAKLSKLPVRHVKGIYPHNAAAVPSDLSTHLTQVQSNVRGMASSIWRSIPGEKHEVGRHLFLSHVVPGVPSGDIRVDKDVVRRSVLAASFSKEAFRFWNHRSFLEDEHYYPGLDDVDGSAEEQRYALEFRRCLSTPSSSYLTTNPQFQQWYKSLLGRLRQAWNHTLFDDSAWKNLLALPQLVDTCKAIWALHCLMGAYPQRPEIFQAHPQGAADTKCCFSYYQGGSESEIEGRIPMAPDIVAVYTVIPGFVLDNHIYKADVIYQTGAIGSKSYNPFTGSLV